MALRIEETEFLNRLGETIASQNRNLASQFNSILGDANISTMLETSKMIENSQYYMLALGALELLILVALFIFVKSILNGEFADSVYSRIFSSISKQFEDKTKQFNDQILSIQGSFDALSNSNETLREKFNEHTRLLTKYITTIKHYQSEIEVLQKDRDKIRAELFKTQNILQKKLKKSKTGDTK